MKNCPHCKSGWFHDQRYGTDVECVNGVLIDIDVYHEGYSRDTQFPLAPCHPEYSKPIDEQINDSQDRLQATEADEITARQLELEDREDCYQYGKRP